jgi:hypothetical protein
MNKQQCFIITCCRNYQPPSVIRRGSTGAVPLLGVDVAIVWATKCRTRAHSPDEATIAARPVSSLRAELLTEITR